MQLTGVHHLTAVTAEVARNHAFYTRTLGLRLVKKSVNQDDVSAYHLFYADGVASPGTDLTFFDWPVGREGRGTHSIVSTGLRVRSEADLAWWRERLAAAGAVCGEPQTRYGRSCLPFEDFEGQRLCLTVDPSPGGAHPWTKSEVPAERQIVGLGPIVLSVPSLGPTERMLTKVMNLRAEGQYRLADSRGDRKGAAPERDVHVFAMGSGGPAAELHVMVEPDLLPARGGAGGVHHVAFRVPDDAQYEAWAERLSSAGIRHSGPVDRYYFRSLYFREPNGILFELATDGPGFAVDEPMETLGERLALPPFLEHRRQEIEAGLKPL
jgi:glyoxalase family protein